MVKIPKKQDPTIEAMKRAVEVKVNSEPRRTYIGASAIGHECSRKLWYDYNGYERLPIEWKGCFAIMDGHRTEDLIAERLRMIEGLELHTERADGSQYGFEHGSMKGHYDGIIYGLKQAPKTWHIWECKAVNEKRFKDFQKKKDTHSEKEALKNWDYTYYCQAILYMHAEGLTRHYTTIATAGGRDIDSCRTEANTKLATSLLAKAERIAKAKEPPERAWHKDFYKCKWCEFREECHG